MTGERLKKIGIGLAILLVLSGIFTAVFFLFKGQEKDPLYQGEIAPEDYKITELKKLSEKDEKNERDVYAAKIVYVVDGFGYTKYLKLYMKPKEGGRLYTSFMEKDGPEKNLGILYYKAEDPAVIGLSDNAEVRTIEKQ